MTVKEVSEYLHIHPKTVYKWTEEGSLTFCRIHGQVRFRQDDIERFVESGRCLNPAEMMPKTEVSLASYDRMHLKGGKRALRKSTRRWNYGRKGIFRRRLKSGRESWCIWYYEKTGRVKKETVRGATCRGDAIRVLEKKVREAFNKEHGIFKKTIRFREFASVYLEKYAKVKKRSWKTDEKYLNVHLIPFFGSMELSEITPEHVSEFVKRDKDGVKSSTVNKHLQVLRKMMNLAVDYRYEIEKNPVRAFHFSSEAGFRRIRVLSSEEEEKLVKVASPHLKSIIQFALDTGLRLQEILTLQTEDVDFGQEVIRIRPEVNKSGKHDFIPLLPRPKELISNLKAANGGRTSFVFNYLDPHTNELRPIRSIQHAFQTACRKAGITGLQFRDLRRTFSTRLHEKGLDLLIIQRLLRHSSPRISAEVYIQTSMRMMKEALEKISSREEKPANLEQIWNMGRMEKDKQLLNPWFSVN